MMSSRKTVRRAEWISLIALVALLLLVVYYLKETYVLNLLDGQYPLFVRRFTSPEIHLLPNPETLELAHLFSTRILSVFVFQLLFFALDAWLFWIVFRSRRVLRLHISISLLLTVVMVLFFALNSLSLGMGSFYLISRLIKDFFQSPVYIFVMLIIFKAWIDRTARSMG